MATNEETRYALHRRREEVLGTGHGTRLMEYLPPVGWSDLATAHDLAALGTRLELHFDRIDDRFSALARRFDEAERRWGERLENVRVSLSSDLHQELANVYQTMTSQFRALVFTVVMAMIGIAGVVVGAIKV
jgi:hypothetical protein